MKKAIMNWSGGKDSALALYYILQNPDYKTLSLFTSLSRKFNRISMHGVRHDLLVEQAKAIGIHLETVELAENIGMEKYSELMNKKMNKFKLNGITHSIFGDIFLEDLRAYRDKEIGKNDITMVYPLWKRNTFKLLHEFIDLGFKAITVCVNSKYLDKSFVGRIIDKSFLNDLPQDVDPCGENGEFHSFVFNGPIFSREIPFRRGEIIHRGYKSKNNTHFREEFYFCDLVKMFS